MSKQTQETYIATAPRTLHSCWQGACSTLLSRRYKVDVMKTRVELLKFYG
ncbi:MAG: hypothetical protein HYZ46_09055 [Nitrosomonadales bacterium]|nr:hypothetical protein [Nitrosomonadales bacterium]